MQVLGTHNKIHLVKIQQLFKNCLESLFLLLLFKDSLYLTKDKSVTKIYTFLSIIVIIEKFRNKRKKDFKNH